MTNTAAPTFTRSETIKIHKQGGTDVRITVLEVSDSSIKARWAEGVTANGRFRALRTRTVHYTVENLAAIRDTAAR